MKYVISDIHGHFDKFMQMLELIKFSDKDELYILGDIIDRGDKPLEVFDYVIGHKNIHLIRGNHEEMCKDAFASREFNLWAYNGGGITYEALMEKGERYLNGFLYVISRLPYYMIVDNYLLVHAGVYTKKNVDNELNDVLEYFDNDFSLWDRSAIESHQEINGYEIICGHTPVQYITSSKENKIINKNGKTYIDCGVIFGEKGKLGCLCLDTKETFYV